MVIALVPPPAASSGTSGISRTKDRRAVWALLMGRRSKAAPDHATPIPNELAHAIVRDGISGEILVPLAELLELGPTQLAPVIGVDRATARRYAQNDQPLPRHSAETVLRLAELEILALDVFATEAAAHGWLKQPHPLLGESPIDAAST